MQRSAVLAVAVAVAFAAAACSSGGVVSAKHVVAHVHAKAAAARPAKPASVRLAERPAGTLAEPVQDAAAAAVAGKILLLGGLTAADVSRSDVRLVSGRRDGALGSLPVAVHDAAAVALGGSAYVFGGGTGTAQLDTIVRIDAATGRTSAAGRLPAPSSDQAAAAVRGTAYVVGGYTGSRWLDTIVAWRPGGEARVVAHLPSPVRYAAVAAVAGKLVIAGGSLPAGTASRAILVFDPATRTVRRLGLLPAPTTHAAAAALGSVAYVIGGRGAAPGTPTARIVAVDVPRGRVVPAGSLATPVSDLAALHLPGRIALAGGRDPSGTTSALGELVPAGSVPVARVPASLDARNVYAAAGPNMLSPVVANVPPRVYVPNSGSNTVDVIDQATRRIVAHYAVGALPQHVTPSYDLRTLYVDNDVGNSLTRVSPYTGRPKGPPISVDDPYNLYFTPDGLYAIVVAERNHRLDFRDAQTMRLRHALTVPCSGVDHMDFSADGSYAIVSCEFSGEMLKVDIAQERVVGVLHLRAGSMPQDVKLSPDGKVFYVADMASDGLWEIDGERLRTIGFLPTGRGVHGLYPSRDARWLYATNRGEGSISVISFATRKVVKTWRLPGGGSPDMGGVSADGKTLWLSGRYNGVVYAISTVTGRLLATIPVGGGPHGLCVWPQPGRYSLGHTGILR